MLPNIEPAHQLSSYCSDGRLLIIAEGFEKRALSWIQQQPPQVLFSQSIICKYEPEQRGQFDEVYAEVKSRSSDDPIVLPYNRFDPTQFEHCFEGFGDYSSFSEILIDISVMSKLLIMIIIHVLRNYSGRIVIVYTEPKTWSPSEAEYKEYVRKNTEGYSCVGLSSVGVYDIVKTPGLSSIVMQDSQPKLITFTSSNEHLLVAILNEVAPASTLLINAKNEREPWRATAALEIHQKVIDSFGIKDRVECYDLLDYKRVFTQLVQEYTQNCYTNRIILAPTGGKIHTLACALLKACCSDIHIEYPTPESYVFESYSSEEIEGIHEVIFTGFKDFLNQLRIDYNLDG